MTLLARNPKTACSTRTRIAPFQVSWIVLMVTLLLSACTQSTRTPTPAPTFTPIQDTPAPTLTFTPIPTPSSTPIPNSPTPTPQIGSTMRSEKDGMLMVYVPAGAFLMGSDANAALVECQKVSSICKIEWFTDEQPPHTVELDAFWIDQTEVTNAQYALCVADGACTAPWHTDSATRSSYYDDPRYANYPVINVNHSAASNYCQWAGRRLPSEAEWEKAARGTDGRIYPWGDQSLVSDLVNFCDKSCSHHKSPADNVEDGYADTAPVGSYPSGASPYGALDMAGNVKEWVADWYAADYYASSPAVNPPGPSEGKYAVMRGGAWNYQWDGMRVTRRFSDGPVLYVSSDTGFRCAYSP
jgi:formylglycine-generating enzyme required for sulfatase activity